MDGDVNDYENGFPGANSSANNFLGLGGKRGLSKSNKQAKSNDCIGVPPGMTDSSPRRQDPVDFEDEEEEEDDEEDDDEEDDDEKQDEQIEKEQEAEKPPETEASPAAPETASPVDQKQATEA